MSKKTILSFLCLFFFLTVVGCQTKEEPVEVSEEMLGTYLLVRADSNQEDKATIEDEFLLLRQLGLQVTLEVNADGEAAISWFGEEGYYTWDENQFVFEVENGKEEIPYTYENQEIYFEIGEGDRLIFRKAELVEEE